MKINFILKSVLLIILVVFLPFFIGMPANPAKPDEKVTIQTAQVPPYNQSSGRSKGLLFNTPGVRSCQIQ